MANVANISSEELHKLIDHEQAIVIDVREPAEYKAEHIEGAYNMPLSHLSLHEVMQMRSLKKKLVFHCTLGRRSMTACQKLLMEGAKFNVYNLIGGVNAWRDGGFPTIATEASSPFPIEKQAQVVAGLSILFGIAFGYWVSPFWLILPLLVGIGLVKTALTGWSELTILLAKLPWNK